MCLHARVCLYVDTGYLLFSMVLLKQGLSFNLKIIDPAKLAFQSPPETLLSLFPSAKITDMCCCAWLFYMSVGG